MYHAEGLSEHLQTFKDIGLAEANPAEPVRDGPIAVVVFQLGGPDSLEAVEPFLYNLFSDPDIINFPFARLARPALARLISSRRARHVREHYASIGGKSPIRELTEQQARALEKELRRTIDARVLVAMRYWHPMTQDAVRQFEGRVFRQLILLPLYPQYSKTTTGSSLNEWHRQYRPAAGKVIPVRTVRDFYRDVAYVDAVVEKINQGLDRFDGILRAGPGGEIHLIFSAHGVPISTIEAGDPYQAQIEATARIVTERGGWLHPSHLCYQSRVGPGRWLQPTLHETLQRLAGQGAKQILVIPISFVSDHVETLSEIGIEARNLARRLGFTQFEVMPALNDSPRFIAALAGLVLREAGVQQEVHSTFL